MTLADNLAIIVLAAGQSSRLGQIKQLLPINNKSLVATQLEKALTVSNNVYCVLGCQAEQLQRCIDHLPITTIINSDWESGMASSIAAGVKELNTDINAVMIVLVDQWQIASTDFTKLKTNWLNNPDAIIVSQNNSDQLKASIGPPVIFPARYFSELCQLTGQQGAKPLLKKYKGYLLPVTMAHAFADIDTPEQLSAMNKVINNQK